MEAPLLWDFGFKEEGTILEEVQSLGSMVEVIKEIFCFIILLVKNYSLI